MRDVFYLHSLGKEVSPVSARFNVKKYEDFVTFVYLFIIVRFAASVKLSNKNPLAGA